MSPTTVLIVEQSQRGIPGAGDLGHGANNLIGDLLEIDGRGYRVADLVQGREVGGGLLQLGVGLLQARVDSLQLFLISQLPGNLPCDPGQHQPDDRRADGRRR